MSKFVTKFKYLKPGGKKKPGGYAKYIGTRDGVEVIDDTHKSTAASLKQKEFISKLVEDYPECMEMIAKQLQLRYPTSLIATLQLHRCQSRVQKDH